jgi:hypothetical protein
MGVTTVVCARTSFFSLVKAWAWPLLSMPGHLLFVAKIQVKAWAWPLLSVPGHPLFHCQDPGKSMGVTTVRWLLLSCWVGLVIMLPRFRCWKNPSIMRCIFRIQRWNANIFISWSAVVFLQASGNQVFNDYNLHFRINRQDRKRDFFTFCFTVKAFIICWRGRIYKSFYLDKLGGIKKQII